MAFGFLKSFAGGVKAGVRAAEDWWFDATRHVKTAGNAAQPDASQVAGETRDSHIYAPVRVANAHAALRDLPIGGPWGTDYSQYTFVDVGSGKGRMLFVAAEYPFRRVIGVEFAMGLHEQALENIERYRHSRQRCGEIESICGDAAEFEFPEEDMVVYLFNPFGPEVMGRMLVNLERSLERHPRRVTVVMLWPEHADMVARMPGMRAYRQTRRHHIYESVSGTA
jgi:SAM-dependent methyltransferase